MTQTIEPAEGEIHFMVNGIQIYLEYANFQKSNPHKIPFVIQHGHTANHYFVKPIYDFFKAKGWPVLSFDWRGHGLSQKNLSGTYTLPNCVADLHFIFEHFLQAKFGFQKMYLLGHSMGGFIAQLYATQYPQNIAKLVLIATAPKLASNWAVKLGMRVVISQFKKNYDYWFNTKKKQHLEIDPELKFFPQWEHPELLPDPKATIEFLQDMFSYDVTSELPKIKIPTYIVVGGKDNLKKASKSIGSLIPGSIFELLPGYVHNITIQARDVLPARIETFLMSVK